MRVEIQESGQEFVLLEDYSIKTSLGIFIIPKGFSTDLASIPSVFWSIVSPLEAHFPAAVLHDYFYRVPESRINGEISREKADDLFLEKMEDLDISWLKRWLFHKAVRYCGNSSWRT